MSTSYIIGFAIGIVITLIMILVVMKVAKGFGLSVCGKYDERQEGVKNKGYRLAFYVMIFYYMCLMVVSMAELPVPMPYLIFLGVVVSTLSYAVYCIIKGAYIGYNQNMKKVVIMLTAIMILNLIPAVINIAEGTTVTERFFNVNLLCATMLLVVIIASLIKAGIDKRTGERN